MIAAPMEIRPISNPKTYGSIRIIALFHCCLVSSGLICFMPSATKNVVKIRGIIIKRCFMNDTLLVATDAVIAIRAIAPQISAV